MLKIILPIALICTTLAIGQTPCENNLAGPFPCSGYDLISQIPLSAMNSVKANDSWGWTDLQDGKEYAIICLNEATAFIDISDPLNPIYLGQLPGNGTEQTTWRDAKTYNDHVFIVSEDDGHGMQVFDLTRLRNVPNPPQTFTTDALYTAFGSAHNIAINEDTGFAYILGSDMSNGGPHFINIQDPVNPVGVGEYTADGYSHDAHIVTYNGPDTDYIGREILFGSNEIEVVIEDVTDKSNPITIATIGYANINYTHQGWLTEDQRYFIMGDETDEINIGIPSRTIVFDFNDLDNPLLHFEYSGPSDATDHNGYVKGDKFYLANNAAGLRVLDISDIAGGTMTEIGYFDTYPTDNNAGFNGSWSIYPYFDSGHIVISDRVEGFLLVKPKALGIADIPKKTKYTLVPNPATDMVTLASAEQPIDEITITDVLGKRIFNQSFLGESSVEIDLQNYDNGIYLITVNKSLSYKLIKQ